MNKLKDLTGQIFGRLTVLERAENRISKSGRITTRWLCICECGNKKIVDGSHLCSGAIKSCGCLGYETKINNGKLNKKFNKYNLTGEYGIGWTNNTNKEFYFDLEDYDKIKNYCWYEDDNGYIVNRLNNETILMHRLILNCKEGEITDHKYRNKYDNRKQYLRKCNTYENSRNISIPTNNSSGVIGVSWIDDRNKWRSRICVNYEQIILGEFDGMIKAIVERLYAEKKYFGEFAPQRHLFEQYGIT